MKACVLHAPKDLRIEPVELPKLGPRQVLLKVGAGGICGSDMHYYFHGGFGTVRVKEPIILGHEVSGTVVEAGAEVTRVKAGDRVAISPSRPCGACRYCLSGHANHCLEMRFYGSAMPFPHIQGAFRQQLVAEEWQCFPVGPHVSLNAAAFSEPLACALHAVARAGDMLGRQVLVTGSGPIGALVIAAARRAGASFITATDVADAPLAAARMMGADLVINVAKEPEALSRFEANKGHFDVVIECSANPTAVKTALTVARPGAVIVLVGMGGEIPVPLNVVTAKELQLRGTFRFHEEFGWAADFISRGLIDVAPLLTETIPIEQADRAFALASDRNRAMKVQLSFD